MSDVQQDRGWLWTALFVAFGLFNIADYFHASGADIHHAISGVGFLLVAPQLFLHPVRFTKPLLQQFKTSPRPSNPIDWLALIGIVLLVSGVIVRWL